MASKTTNPRSTGYLAKQNLKGEKVLVPIGFSKGISALRRYANNHVVEGCLVSGLDYAVTSATGCFSVGTGVIVQEGFTRFVNGVSNKVIDARTAAKRISVYVPALGTWNGATLNNRYTPSVYATPTYTFLASTANTYPTVPPGSIVLAHIYYLGSYGDAGLGSNGATLSWLDRTIDNDARPNLWKQEGDWVR